MSKFYYFFIVILIVIAGYLVWHGEAKAPTTDEQSITTNTSQNSDNNEEKVMTNLAFPGVLPNDQIEGKKVVVKTDKGTIEFELYADKAPNSVSNFIYLAEKGYYDGLTFHRVVPDFVIQGGDPTGNGSGGPDYKFPDEPVVGDYKAGTVAMANSGPDTNGSQFFICLTDQPTLPKNYNLFGQVTIGMDIVAKIAVGDKMTSVT
ncbi:MAG TPA: peptidylprolyl isomerase, partial [Patescibacteria group bacterium]|nr:peptidylprolyl isomerase [Patescibacteria group bacterium]